MRLVTFEDSAGKPRVGIHTGPLGQGKITDAAKAAQALGRHMGADDLTLLQTIERWSELKSIFQVVQEAAEAGRTGEAETFEESKTKLLSPLPRPVSMRDGYAFRQHVEAARRNRGVPMIPEFDLFPIFYYTNHLQVSGPGPISVQKQAQVQLDFELEIAVVMGSGGKNLKASEIDEKIFGYTIMNDWSARHLQMEEMKLNLGPAKGKDLSTSLGPYLVTRDELKPWREESENGERYNLRMRCTVNGKQVSDGNARDMTWTFAQILERAAYGVELHAGEVIGSGTVGTGCFLELNGSKITDNQWLKPGDEVILEVDGLGKLVNTIVDGGP
jgi:fumarylacetoacetate (FAA) hydrolase